MLRGGGKMGKYQNITHERFSCKVLQRYNKFLKSTKLSFSTKMTYCIMCGSTIVIRLFLMTGSTNVHDDIKEYCLCFLDALLLHASGKHENFKYVFSLVSNISKCYCAQKYTKRQLVLQAD